MFHLLGKMSYSFYLLHPITLLVVWTIPEALGSIVAAGVPRVYVSLVLWLTSAAAIAPIAWASYRFVELPGQRLGNAIRGWIGHTGAPVPQPITAAGKNEPAG